jgi:hypothetical protein
MQLSQSGGGFGSTQLNVNTAMNERTVFRNIFIFFLLMLMPNGHFKPPVLHTAVAGHGLKVLLGASFLFLISFLVSCH